MNCNPNSSYKIPEDLILESFLTTINDHTSQNIEDAWAKMVETFNRTKPCKVEPQAKILKEDKQVDTRLAQLGIDNGFKLERLKDGSVEYRPHEFCFCPCPNTQLELWIEPAPEGTVPDKTDQELEAEREVKEEFNEVVIAYD